MSERRRCFLHYDREDRGCQACYDRDECKVRSAMPRSQRFASRLWDEVLVLRVEP